MTRTPSQVSADILAKLAVTDPSLSFELGTPERKILDIFAEEVSSSEVDNAVVSQNSDIDSLTGADLEEFVGLFGFGRMIGQYASGVITFSLSSPATSAIQFPLGTQVYTSGTDITTQIYFATTVPASIAVGQLTVSVAATATVTGVVGNAAANSITGYTTSIGTISVINASPFVGGTDPETDDQLRTRFKATFMRNIAGTSDFYSALCSQQDAVANVKVMGPVNTFVEQLQIEGGTVTSSIYRSQYTWSDGELLSQNFGSAAEIVYNPGIDYSFATSTPPVVTVLNPTKIPNGTIVDLQHQYVPIESRNNPPNGITNKIDIYVDGQDAVQVTEQAIISSTTLNTTSGSPYNINNFVRASGALPVSGHRFQQLGSLPVIAAPQSCLVGSTPYNLNTDYLLLYADPTNLYGSTREVSGLEWITSSPPAAGSSTNFTYTYNRIPETLQAVLNKTKQITSDPLVHQVKYTYLQINMIMMYTSGYNPTSVDAAALSALIAWASNIGFGAWIQFSDVEAIVHGVAGVDNCRMVTSADGISPYGINVMGRNGTQLSSHVTDFILYDAQLASIYALNTTRKSYNTFRAS